MSANTENNSAASGYDPLCRTAEADYQTNMFALGFDPFDRTLTLTLDNIANIEPKAIYINGQRFIPERICHDVSDSADKFICSECGCNADTMDEDMESTVHVGGIATTFHACPNCCAKVV